MPRRVIIRRRLQQHEVGLRFRVLVKLHRILHGDNPSAFAEIGEEAVEAFRHAPVKWSDGRHINDLPVEEFNPRIRLEHSDFSHAMILLGGESMFCLNPHGNKLLNHLGTCKPTFAATCATSLSPRPERFTMTSFSLPSFGASWITSAMACADSRAGMIPSSRASFMNASSAWSSVA